MFQNVVLKKTFGPSGWCEGRVEKISKWVFSECVIFVSIKAIKSNEISRICKTRGSWDKCRNVWPQAWRHRLCEVPRRRGDVDIKRNIYTFQRDTQCCSTDCLLMHRCQLYMFRTVTTISTTPRPILPQTLYQRDVSDSAVLTTYHSLHIQHLKRSSWG